MAVQLSALSRSKAENPPNTTRMATKGIMELTPSIFPLLPPSPQSVIQALKQASLADEPRKVITQSSTITSVMPKDAAPRALPARGVRKSTRRSAKARMDRPQARYPPQIKALRFPT